MGAPITVVCESPQYPGDPPSISIPNYGILEKAQASVSSISDPLDMLVQFQDMIGVALGPVRRYLEIIEAFDATKQCMMVIPEAISKLDPGVFWDCFKNLTKAYARLLSYLPPFSYVRLGMGIASYCIDVINGVCTLALTLDQKITGWIRAYDTGVALGDLELVQSVNCAMGQVSVSLQLVMKLLKFIKPANDVLRDMFLRYLNNPALESAYKAYDDMGAFFTQVDTALAGGDAQLPSLPGFTPPAVSQHAIVPIPPLGSLFEALTRTHNNLAQMYNALAPLVGEDPNKSTINTPSFQNF